MKRSFTKTAATLAIGVAAIGTTMTPALAASPSPSSLGLASAGSGWTHYKMASSFCILGADCVGSLWIADSTPYPSTLQQSAGYVRGSKAAQARATATIKALKDPALQSLSRKKYTKTYSVKKRQHKLVLTVTKLRLADPLGVQHGQLTLAREHVRKHGKTGPFTKKVGIAVSLILTNRTIPKKLGAKKAKKLSIQMRGLIKTGARNQVSGAPKWQFVN